MDKERLTKAVDKLNIVADTIYKGNMIKGMADMVDIIPVLAEVTAELKDEQQEHFVNDALKPVLNAMEEKDGTMMADIILYEIVPQLEQL